MSWYHYVANFPAFLYLQLLYFSWNIAKGTMNPGSWVWYFEWFLHLKQTQILISKMKEWLNISRTCKDDIHAQWALLTLGQSLGFQNAQNYIFACWSTIQNDYVKEMIFYNFLINLIDCDCWNDSESCIYATIVDIL